MVIAILIYLCGDQELMENRDIKLQEKIDKKYEIYQENILNNDIKYNDLRIVPKSYPEIDGKCGTFFHMITRMQDEVHRTAITYHRNLRGKITSELDSIRGVGEKRRNELITHFKTVENIKKASFEELMNVKGMDKKTAENIINYFKKED